VKSTVDSGDLERGLRRVAENRIETAREEGVFEKLPGEGKPLPADRFRDVDPSWRLALRVLDGAGFAPTRHFDRSEESSTSGIQPSPELGSSVPFGRDPALSQREWTPGG
jgi:hypothetical protein